MSCQLLPLVFLAASRWSPCAAFLPHFFGQHFLPRTQLSGSDSKVDSLPPPRPNNSTFAMSSSSIVDGNKLRYRHPFHIEMIHDDDQDQNYNYEPMPWKTSIQGSSHDLTFMSYFHWTTKLLHEHDSIHNLRPLSFDTQYQYQQSANGRTRIINSMYQSDEYRKIRMTYLDSGKVQVFNTLWYPRGHFRDQNHNSENDVVEPLPVLGVDLIQLSNRFLVVVDFQPLYDENDDHKIQKKQFPHVQKVWEEDIPSILKGKMSKRFYDESQFFSKNMIFSRFSRAENEEQDIVNGDLWDAFQSYVTMYIDMIKEETGQGYTTGTHHHEDGITSCKKVLDRQRDYDTYSAKRDPAHAMFIKMFGKDWADGFVFDFLFSLSENYE